MTAKPSGDPARELTRDEVQARHDAMAAAEPDWVHQANVLVAALERATVLMQDDERREELCAVASEYRRVNATWMHAADDYFNAIGGPIAEVLPLESNERVAEG